MSLPIPSIHTLAMASALAGSLFATQANAGNTFAVDLTITGPLNGVVGNPTQTDSVLGSITTDGTIGFLHAANILSWDLNLVDVDNPQYSIELTQSNSQIIADSGSVLSTDGSGLFFNFAETGAFAFQANSPGAFSGYHYWCLSHNYYACADGNSIAPSNVYPGNAGNDFVVAASGTQGLVGNAPLNQPVLPPTVPAVPEPSTFAMFGLGLAALAFTQRRRTPTK